MNPVGPLLAFAITTALIVLLRPIAIAVGLVDVPAGRKDHRGNIPLIGGMAIFLAALTVYAALSLFKLGGYQFDHKTLAAFFSGSLVLIVVGVWDDYRDLPPAARFVAQIFAALIMIYPGGVVLVDLGMLSFSGGILVLGVLAVPFTIFACLGVINAMNMCDGLDGLSGSLALIGLAGLGIADSFWGTAGNQDLILLFAACVAGFLLFNLRTLWRSRACVFLGDAGSMLLGYTLAWLLICSSQGEVRVISPSAALWFLMLPIYDAVSMMLRRVLRGQSPFAADREHLHHIFLLAGFSVSETVTLMTGIAIAGVSVGLIGTWLMVPDVWLAGTFLAIGLLYYWAVCRAWRLMRFLRRSICRRSDADRRASARDSDAGGVAEKDIVERRSGKDRRMSA